MFDTEKYSIKLDRAGGLHPEDISARELAELLAVLSKQFADGGNDFCLTALADNCVRLDFRISSHKVKAAIVKFSALISGQPVASDSPVFQNLEEFDRVRARFFADISMTFPAIAEFPAVTLPSDRKLADLINKEPNLRYQHTVYGKVMGSGGDQPSIHIRPLGGGPDIICDCSEELAAEVGCLLYSVVGIVGEVTHHAEPIRMKAQALLPYREPSRNPFTLLKEAGAGKYFENRSVTDFMREVRGDDGDGNV